MMRCPGFWCGHLGGWLCQWLKGETLEERRFEKNWWDELWIDWVSAWWCPVSRWLDFHMYVESWQSGWWHTFRNLQCIHSGWNHSSRWDDLGTCCRKGGEKGLGQYSEEYEQWGINILQKGGEEASREIGGKWEMVSGREQFEKVSGQQCPIW